MDVEDSCSQMQKSPATKNTGTTPRHRRAGSLPGTTWPSRAHFGPTHHFSKKNNSPLHQCRQKTCRNSGRVLVITYLWSRTKGMRRQNPPLGDQPLPHKPVFWFFNCVWKRFAHIDLEEEQVCRQSRHRKKKQSFGSILPTSRTFQTKWAKSN